jgi:hypothetical protein
MADIQVKDLVDRNFNGTDLFDDLENFMIELSDDNGLITGGMKPQTIGTGCFGTGCAGTGCAGTECCWSEGISWR